MAKNASSPFRSARLKIQRANTHIDELQSAITSLGARGFYGIDVYTNREKTAARVVMYPREPIPDSLPLIIGDAVHNLKSALDHAFAEAVGSSLSQADIMFPFSKERKRLVGSARIKAIELALAGAESIILDKIQPYENGQMNLYGLHLLDRIDKHNQLIITAQGTTVGKIDLVIDGKPSIKLRNCRFNAQEPVTLYEGPGQIAVECDFKATFDIRFGKALPFGDEPVVPTLIQLMNVASEALDLLAALTR